MAGSSWWRRRRASTPPKLPPRTSASSCEQCDIVNILRHIVEPGFFGSGPVHIALAVGTVVAVTSAVTGVFTVTRGQSFAGHSLADIATTGGSGAFLVEIGRASCRERV